MSRFLQRWVKDGAVVTHSSSLRSSPHGLTLVSSVHSWYVDSYLISEISLVNNKIRVLVHKGKPDFMMNPVTTVDD